jgi:hypothetical protein
MDGLGVNQDLSQFFYKHGADIRLSVVFGESIMTWVDLAENPSALTSLFDSAPSLENVELFSVKTDRDGPTVELIIGLDESPASPPARWQYAETPNATSVTLQLIDLESFQFDGWSTTNTVKISIQRLPNEKLELTANGGTTRLNCCCGWLRIGGVSPYRRDMSRDNL